MEDRLARPAVPHRGRVHREERPVGRVVVGEKRLVGAHADISGNVVALRVAHQRVDHQPVDRLERHLGEVLMSPMDRVPRLEAHDPAPALLGKEGARLGGRAAELGERRVLGAVQHRHITAQVHVAGGHDPRDGGMCLFRGAEDALCLVRLVVAVLLREGQDADDPIIGVDEGDLGVERQCLSLVRADRQRDRDRPGQSVLEAHLLDDATVVRLAHEAGQRAEGTVADQLEVGQRHAADRDARQPGGACECVVALGAVERPADERPAVGHRGRRRGRHAELSSDGSASAQLGAWDARWLGGGNGTASPR